MADVIDDLDDFYDDLPAVAQEPAQLTIDHVASPMVPAENAGLPGLAQSAPSGQHLDHSPHALTSTALEARSVDEKVRPDVNAVEKEPGRTDTTHQEEAIEDERLNPQGDVDVAQHDANVDRDFYEGEGSGKVEQEELAQDTVGQGTESSAVESVVVDNRALDTQVYPPQTDASMNATSSKVDAEFIEAGAAQAGNEQAEWQLDSSDNDSDSSSDSSSSGSSSDDDSDEDDYELLDPATAAKMLMAEEGGEDDDDNKAKPSGNSQLRTKNEQPPVVVPKPDVTVTPEMKITLLGDVESIVDTYVLIGARVSGEYQVLESGSVLCLEDRTVIGAVAETLGRVQKPMYSVAFTTRQEIDEMGLSQGGKVFYVDSHSTFVFTQPLQGLKGTDASNLHDEEVGDDEMEFSDDEAEAAYKRAKKEARRGGKTGSKPARRNDDGAYAAIEQPISYDDADGESMYTPLARPTNLQDLSNDAPPPLEQIGRRQTFDRGRGRGTRGRGERGRGDRGRNARGGRGGRGDDRPRRGAAHSYPDQHNSRHDQPTRSAVPPQSGSVAPSGNWSYPPLPPPVSYGAGQNQQHPQITPQAQQQLFQLASALQQQQQQREQQQQQQQQHQAQPYAWPQNPSPQQGTPNMHSQMPYQAPHGQFGQDQIPAGAFMNPAFFAQQGQAQHQQPATNPGQTGGQAMDPAYAAALQQQLDVIRRSWAAQ